ncbi:endolytic transglycosylase MltG [Pedobacter sp. HMF7647]|uniref:Endolytic murein transglycosylase n=1 Tax=Hufsiella arboris TaxID=2695275 RepID=A0A7K1Y798_9SPHI|nr:endolytic transglycosylase MltG [Hufsiella arboris]MXV50443.1 endolytic transglycosylase MltG [Hufsiella arboris]
MTEKKSGLTKKIIISLAVIIVIALGITVFNYYLRYFGPNVTGEKKYLYIKTGATFDDVFKTVKDSNIVKDTTYFLWTAHNMDYTTRVKPGRYTLKKGMSNRGLINMLKAGNQEPVKLKFHNIRLKKDFAKYISTQLETDSTSLLDLLNSSDFVGKYGFTTDNVYAMFIPNSYEVYWNTPADKFFKRMYDEYQKFWTAERKQKAQAIGLTEQQVSSLAAIVDAEALHDDEMPMIAGLYMNRYKKGMKLEADPTVIFATGDFNIHRVLNKHLRTESPYNTYLHTGLPPGPIMMPSIKAIDAVLNYKKHDFIYMVAKEDFSGYHNFSSNMAQHLAYAHKFQAALDERNIKK